jgi:tRNA-2-methylthio-N6-dimethylallyladenosine synthase
MDIDVSKYFKPNLSKARRRSKSEVQHDNFEINEIHKNLGHGKKYWIQTYGCQANEADGETMAGILKMMSFSPAANENEASIIIINTCAIRENAENRVWGVIGRLKKLKIDNPDLLICLSGCMAQEENVVNKILKTYHQVDIVFGTHNIHKLPDYIQTAMFSKERVIEVYSEEGNVVENLPKFRNHKKKGLGQHNVWM